MNIDELSKVVYDKSDKKISALKVAEINRIQWKFLLNEIQSGEFNSVQIFYIGKFFKKKSKSECFKLRKSFRDSKI